MPLGGLKSWKRRRGEKARDAGLGELEELIAGIPPELRKRAFTHYTWVEDVADSYKRLALIGDSVLALSAVADLDTRFSDAPPGRLSQIRERVVCGVSCKEVGLRLGVGKALEGMNKPDLRHAVPTKALLAADRPVAEITEALIGACFQTYGFDRISAAVAKAFEPHIEIEVRTALSPKSKLQILLDRRRSHVNYEVVSKTGPDSEPTFEVAAIVSSKRIGRGKGRSKKAAEHAAAEHALQHLSANKAE
jgi:ribonuclease III